MQIISGTVGNAVQMQAMNNEWLQKKKSGNVLSKKERNEQANWTQEERLLQDLKEQAEKNREAIKKNSIDSKIMYGGTLTPEEEKYLEENAPATLQKYKQMKIEKKVYEEKLQNCKTKDEVQRLKTETMGQYVASLKKVENNPHIPISEKIAKAQEIIGKISNIQDAEMKFMQTSKYANLPTEAQEAQAQAKYREYENEEAVEQIEENVKESTTHEIDVSEESDDEQEKVDDSIETLNRKKKTNEVADIEKMIGKRVNISV